MHACMQNHKDEQHGSLEKYTSHFIWKGSKGLLKVLLCERWVGVWTELQHIDPHTYGHNSVSFLFSWSAQPRAWEPSLSETCSSFQHLLSNWLNFLCTELYNCSTPTRRRWESQIALNSTRPWSRLYPDIPQLDAPVIYTGAFPILMAWPGSICYIFNAMEVCLRP